MRSEENGNFTCFESYCSRRIEFIKIARVIFDLASILIEIQMELGNGKGPIDKILNSSFHLDSNFNLINIIIKFHPGNSIQDINLKSWKNLARFSNLDWNFKFIIQIGMKFESI